MRRHGVAQGPKFYDQRHLESAQRGAPVVLKLTREVARHVTGSVLDLGCGLGILAEFVEGPYLGVDFSPVAIRLAGERNTNPHAKFMLADICQFKPSITYDTVVAVETLEHLDDPSLVAALAIRSAKQRIIVSVPQDMQGCAHVWPRWEPRDIKKMLGQGTRTYRFGPWWIGTLDL